VAAISGELRAREALGAIALKMAAEYGLMTPSARHDGLLVQEMLEPFDITQEDYSWAVHGLLLMGAQRFCFCQSAVRAAGWRGEHCTLLALRPRVRSCPAPVGEESVGLVGCRAG